jgi:hypothetical protein
MFDFNDRRGAADRVSGFLQKVGFGVVDMKHVVTPFNPNEPHPLDNPESTLSKSVKRDPYEPTAAQKMQGMTSRDVKKMRKTYDFSTGLPIAKKSLRGRNPGKF